jgi:hypothetical protein
VVVQECRCNPPDDSRDFPFTVGLQLQISESKKPPEKTFQGHSDGYVVAGTGLEPVTFGL